jgi:hypothetical protein
MDFIRLDAGSEWSNRTTSFNLLREGKLEEARQAVKKMADTPGWHRDLLEACLSTRPDEGLDKIVAQTEAMVMAQRDPEAWYEQGSILSYCGKKDVCVALNWRGDRTQLLRHRRSEGRPITCEDSGNSRVQSVGVRIGRLPKEVSGSVKLDGTYAMSAAKSKVKSAYEDSRTT